MTDHKREFLVEPLAGYDVALGAALWMLDDARRRTKLALGGLNAAVLDWSAPEGSNSIGTLLYHIPAIEMDWLYHEVLQQPFAPAIQSLFPYPVRDERGWLTVVREPLDAHLRRMDTARAAFLGAFQNMSVDDFRRPRRLPDYDVSPQWVLHHLCQHEAEHRGEILTLHSRAEYELGKP